MGQKSYTHSFAQIYDKVMSTVPYDLWYRYIQELLSHYNREPQSVLDLACGTGNMTLKFAGGEKTVVGLDGSSEMLNVARRKAEKQQKEVSFVESDLRDFDFSRKFDLVFSVFDSLNYILSLDDLKKVFANVEAVLTDDGVFIFDMNTLHRLMSIEPGTAMFTGDDYTCIWEDKINEKEKKWIVELKIELEGKNNGHFEERHEETSYPLFDIEKILAEVGLFTAKRYKAFTFSKGGEKDNRVYFVVFKNIPNIDFPFHKILAKKLKWTFWKIFRHRSKF
ncbi:MAG: class I SAM-dependent DNA methyltransferase [Halanaerobiaceae bacterium]